MATARAIRAQGADPTWSAYCFSTDQIGDCVYVMGPKVGSRYQVTGVDIDAVSFLPGVGIIVSKASPTECTVQSSGIVTGLYSGLTPGRPLFIGTDSRLTQTFPPPTAGQRWLQVVATAVSAEDFLVGIHVPVGVLA